MRGKTFVWTFWLVTAVLSACYGALSLYTFIALTKLKSRGYKSDGITDTLLKGTESKDKAAESLANTWGLYASTILSFACVAFYVVFTLLVLLRKSFKSKAATGYGIIMSSAGHTAMVLLLSALVIHASKPRALWWKNHKFFTGNDYLAYWGTFCLGYIMSFIYTMNMLVLMFFKPAMDYTAPPVPVPSTVTSSQHIMHDVEAIKPAAVESPAVEADDIEVKEPKKGWGFKGAWGK